MNNETLIGSVPPDFDTFVLRERLIRNDPGDWGNEPQSGTCGVLRGTNFTNEGLLNLEDVAFRSLSAAKYSEKRLERGDIIIERSGGSEIQPVGRVGFIDEIIATYGYAFSNFVQRITVNDSLNPKFVFYCLQRMYEIGVTVGMQSQTTGIRNLDYKLFLRSRLPEPKRVDQDAIVSAIESIETAIAAVRESITRARRLQNGLMQQLLSGKLDAHGAARNGDSFQETKLGLLPKEWEVARVKDFGEVSTGKTPPTDIPGNFGTDFQFITPGDLGQSKWIRNTERALSALGAEHAGIIPAEAVCVVCIGATIGKIGLTTKPSCTNQQLNTVVCGSDHSPGYLYYALKHRARHLQVIAGVNATPQLNKSDFSKYKLPMPSTLDEEEDIAKKLAIFDELIEAKHPKIVALQRLKKTMMKNLLTGQLRLPLREGTEVVTTTP